MKKRLVFLFTLILPIASISIIYGQEKMDAYLSAQVEAKAFKGSVFVQHKGEILLDIKEEILIPYSLEDTGIISNREMVEELASGYTSDPRTAPAGI